MSLQQVDTYSPIASPRKQTAGETLVSEVVIKQCPNRSQCVCVFLSPSLSLSAAPTVCLCSGLSFHSQHCIFLRFLGEVGQESQE